MWCIGEDEPELASEGPDEAAALDLEDCSCRAAAVEAEDYGPFVWAGSRF